MHVQVFSIVWLYIYMSCRWRSSFQKERAGIPLTSLATPPHFILYPELSFLLHCVAGTTTLDRECPTFLCMSQVWTLISNVIMSFCWYLTNCWQFLHKLSLHKSSDFSMILCSGIVSFCLSNRTRRDGTNTILRRESILSRDISLSWLNQ